MRLEELYEGLLGEDLRQGTSILTVSSLAGESGTRPQCYLCSQQVQSGLAKTSQSGQGRAGTWDELCEAPGATVVPHL